MEKAADVNKLSPSSVLSSVLLLLWERARLKHA